MKPTADTTARLAFAALLLLAAGGFAVWYQLDADRYAAYQVVTHDPVSGLIADAPVELHGVDVGRVERVGLVNARTVDIRLRVRTGTPITRGTIATVTSRGLATRGFTGYVYVALDDDGSDTRPVLASANESIPLIRAGPSRMVNIDTAISRLDENVGHMSELVRTVLDDRTVASLKQSAENLQGVTRTLAVNSDRLAAIIANAERASGMLDTQTIRSVRQSVANLEAVTRTLASNNDRFATIMSNAENASNQLRPLLQSGNAAVDSLQNQVIPEAHNALAGLESLSSSLSNTASRIDRDPSVLLRGRARPPPGPGEAR